MLYKFEKTLFKKKIKELAKRNKNKNIIDFTYGNGRHSKIIMKNINKNRTLNSFEKDRTLYKKNTIKEENFNIHNKNYNEIINIKITNIGMILIDLGNTVNQIKNKYSFEKNWFIGNESDILTRINFYHSDEVEKIFKDFLEKRELKRITKIIIKARKKKMITNTQEIKEIIGRKKHGKKNEFTRIMCSIKNYMEKNKENIERILDISKQIINKNGIIVIISFNSFEARIIKKFERKNKRQLITLEKIKDKKGILKIIMKK